MYLLVLADSMKCEVYFRLGHSMTQILPFQLGCKYTRRDINQAVGGQMQTYLPTSGGRVVCGCFDPSDAMNPAAPEEILFGEPYPTPEIDKSAQLVFEQGLRGEEIPVFLKRATNEWEYIGDYLCIGITRDPRVLARKMASHPARRTFTGVLRFEQVGP